MWTAISFTRPKRVIGRFDVRGAPASGMPCGTSTESEVTGAAAVPVPMLNGTVAEPWSAESASEKLATWPHSRSLSSCTPNAVELVDVPPNASVGKEAVGCGTVTSGPLLVESVPVMPVRSAPGSLLNTVS